MREEKMRIGIEKMQMAHKKRVAIEVYNPDRSKKTGKKEMCACMTLCLCDSVLV